MLSSSTNSEQNFEVLPSGYIISQFQVLYPLQKGSGGSVYKARKLCLKCSSTSLDSVIPPTRSENTKCPNLTADCGLPCFLKVFQGVYEKDLFRREYQALDKLGNKSNNIAKAICFGNHPYSKRKQLKTVGRSESKAQCISEKNDSVDTRISFIVTEFCAHGDLFSYVSCGLTRLNSPLCSTLMLQILKGVYFMHHVSKLAHLDLKLENLVLDHNFRIKLIDVAFSERVDKSMNNCRGTLNYVAPEVLLTTKNQRLFNAGETNLFCYNAEKADIFSLGVILFLFYFGTNPFHSNSSEDTLFQYLSSGRLELAEVYFQNHAVTKNANSAQMIPASLKVLLVKLLNKDPTQRPTVRELLQSDQWLRNPKHGMTVGDYEETMAYIKSRADQQNDYSTLSELTYEQVNSVLNGSDEVL